MDYAISIKLTEQEYYFLKEIARQQYRSLGNCYSMLAAEGLRYYFVDNEAACVKRKPEHCTTEHPEYAHYTEQELIEEFAKIPLHQ